MGDLDQIELDNNKLFKRFMRDLSKNRFKKFSNCSTSLLLEES